MADMRCIDVVSVRNNPARVPCWPMPSSAGAKSAEVAQSQTTPGQVRLYCEMGGQWTIHILGGLRQFQHPELEACDVCAPGSVSLLDATRCELLAPKRTEVAAAKQFSEFVGVAGALRATTSQRTGRRAVFRLVLGQPSAWREVTL